MLVNNAGMSLLYGDLADVSEAMWDKVVGLNLKGPFRLTALVAPRMAADGGGSVINVSSTGSIRPAPFMLPYDAAKAGLNALTVGLRPRLRALGPGQLHHGRARSSPTCPGSGTSRPSTAEVEAASRARAGR